jgi:hypothetical protein
MGEVNLKKLSDAVIAFVGKSPKGQERFQDAASSFFEETYEEWGINTIDDLEERTEPLFPNIMMAFFHYFFSTTFCHEDDDQEWNAIDAFLATRHKLKPEEVHELQSLRWSFLSLYEILDIDLGKSFTVKDTILQGKPLVITEHRATYALKKGEIVAGRLITTADGKNVFAGELFRAPLGGFEQLAMGLRLLSEACFKECKKQIKRKEIPFQTDEVLTQSVRAVWAKEITSAVIHDALERAQRPATRAFVNTHGHPVRICTLTYKIPREMHYTYGNKLAKEKNINVADATKTKAFLEWNEPNAGWGGGGKNKKRSGALKKKGDSQQEEDALIVDSFCPSEHSPSSTELVNIATIEVSPGKIKVTANSRERALMMEEKMASVLDIPMGTATWQIQDPETFEDTNLFAQKGSKKSKVSGGSGLSQKEEQAMFQRYLQEHYQKWPDMNIQALGGKTPRELVKTPDGKIQVAQILASFYDKEPVGGVVAFDFLWEELGLEKPRFLKERSDLAPRSKQVSAPRVPEKSAQAKRKNLR